MEHGGCWLTSWTTDAARPYPSSRGSASVGLLSRVGTCATTTAAGWDVPAGSGGW